MGELSLVPYFSETAPTIAEIRAYGIDGLANAGKIVQFYDNSQVFAVRWGNGTFGDYYSYSNLPRIAVTNQYSVNETFNITRERVYNNVTFYSSVGKPSYQYALVLNATPFNSESEAITAFLAISESYPITYRLTNCTAPSAPTEAAIGDIVTVPLQFTTGYGIVNPSSDVYVTNNGVVVPSQYSNGVLTFTMPDPSQ